MQIQSGTAAVTNGSPVVVASDLNDWSQAKPNAVFIAPGAGGFWYTIGSVRTPGQSTSGRWELTLSVPYQGATDAATPYAIHKDFLPEGIPILDRGDTELVSLLNRALMILARGSAPAIPAQPITTIALSGVLGTNPSVHLQAQPTLGVPLNTIFEVYPSSGDLSRWILKSGTNATNEAAGYVRPTDYQAATNPRVFARIG